MFYQALHSKLNNIYKVQLNGETDTYKKVHEAFNRAAKYLHTKGDFNSEDLKNKEVKPLITETYKVLKQAINTGITTKVPDAMLAKLHDDVFVFSGMKTYTQLKEASLLLTDEKGQIKPYNRFEQDIAKIDATYNKNYLQAEHQTAIATAQSAAQYHDFMQDADRYNLQIRTAGDDKVRASHAALNGITLPADDIFWDTHWTPFDWRCRCRIIQVLKSKYTITESSIAYSEGEKAIPEMFRYNPGKQQIIFPPKHPYYATSKQAMNVIKEMSKDESRSDVIQLPIVNAITTKHVKELLLQYAAKFPEDFSNGLGEVKFRKSTQFLMQHSINVNRVTRKRIGKSSIAISTNTYHNGYNPANHLLEAFNAIKNGQQLSFNQEYAFESLWHEILHAKTNSAHGKLSSIQVKTMETVNQFVARHTYPKLIEAFGGKATNQQQILNDGYGYKSWVKDFRQDLKNKNIDEAKAVEFLEPHLMKDYSNLSSKVKELLNGD
jgi:SPP1 gp7 family putative phage head morphogenesis protein